MEKIRLSWEELKLNSDGMLPVVVQDDKDGTVLMVAYMNKEAYEQTLSTGRMTYWSRSRNELWVKGLTSGHFQYVKSLAIDCDNDTLLIKVHPSGPTCRWARLVIQGTIPAFIENLKNKNEAKETDSFASFLFIRNTVYQDCVRHVAAFSGHTAGLGDLTAVIIHNGRASAIQIHALVTIITHHDLGTFRHGTTKTIAWLTSVDNKHK